MSDNQPLDQRNLPEENEPEIFVNEYGDTRDSAVVVDEPDRTVLLTDDETIVFDKEARIDVVPVNRPRKVYGGMWGQPELITAGLATLAVLTMVLFHIFMVLPTKRELERNRAERDRLERDVISKRGKYGNIENTHTHVAKLMESVDTFETTYLPVAVTGRASLYQRINGLIGAHGLISVTGPEYTPLETVGLDTGVQSDEERGRAKHQSLYPGVYVTMTVEGPYQNIRRFIRAIETGSDFVVVTQVELEPSDTQRQQAQAPQAAAPQVNPPAYDPTGAQGFGPTRGPVQPQQQLPASRRGKTSGEVVSLRLEMAAYFRRANAAPALAQPAE